MPPKGKTLTTAKKAAAPPTRARIPRTAKTAAVEKAAEPVLKYQPGKAAAPKKAAPKKTAAKKDVEKKAGVKKAGARAKNPVQPADEISETPSDESPPPASLAVEKKKTATTKNTPKTIAKRQPAKKVATRKAAAEKPSLKATSSSTSQSASSAELPSPEFRTGAVKKTALKKSPTLENRLATIVKASAKAVRSPASLGMVRKRA